MFDFTPALRLYAKARAAKLRELRPGEAQRRELLRLVGRARNTRFGREHGFDSIRSVEDYQRRVPLRTYEDFWRDYWQRDFPHLVDCTWPGRIRFFPVSSGTSSGTTKYIPCSSSMLASNNKAGKDLLVHHVTNRPHSKILAGKSFMLGGSTDLVEQAPGVFSGDLSGISVINLPAWAKARYFPPAELALLKDWEQKIEILSRRSLGEDIRMLSGVPSWMLIFFSKLRELRPESGGKLARLFPNLEMIVHGGVSFAPYKDLFDDLMQGSRAELREVYPASEGFIAVADRGYGEGLRMNLDHGMFFELVPLDELSSESPTRHWIGNAELGVNYAIVLTTCAGLWSYVIGDTVKLIDRSPPRLLVTGRTSYYLSAFGEHVIAEEIEDAVSRAASSLDLSITDYSVMPVFPSGPNELGYHLYVMEISGAASPESLGILAERIDGRLRERNEDYDGHRADGFGMKLPGVLAVKPGTFAAWMKSRGKLGGQNKVPRVINDRALADGLLELARRQANP